MKALAVQGLPYQGSPKLSWLGADSVFSLRPTPDWCSSDIPIRFNAFSSGLNLSPIHIGLHNFYRLGCLVFIHSGLSIHKQEAADR